MMLYYRGLAANALSGGGSSIVNILNCQSNNLCRHTCVNPPDPDEDDYCQCRNLGFELLPSGFDCAGKEELFMFKLTAFLVK